MLRNEAHAAHAEPAEAQPGRTTAVQLETAVQEEETATQPDDLKIIEGIGPKIEGILHAAGIKKFYQLAATSVTQLEKIGREDGGIRLALQDTCPEQARLAADADWSKLESLQDELKGGRRA